MAIFQKMKLEGLKAFGNTVFQYVRQLYSTFADHLDFFFYSYDLYSIKDLRGNEYQH